MTDKEIIQALERCAVTIESGCGDCPIKNEEKGSCIAIMSRSALDIVKRTKRNELHYRQKVQNQREIINALQNKIERLQAEIERLKATKKLYLDRWEESIKFAHEDEINSIKEFAEKVKEVTYHYYDSDIDNLAKEMVGDTE